MVSEMVTDLANEISQCESWDPATLHSPAQEKVPKPIYADSLEEPTLAKEMAVLVPPIYRGKVDGFIDDLINVFWDTPDNCQRLPHSVPLAMHVTSRPHAGDDQEPLPRRPILSLPKLLAEGAPAEIQIVIGWTLNTRELTIGLPKNKFETWSSELRRIIGARRCTGKILSVEVVMSPFFSFTEKQLRVTPLSYGCTSVVQVY